MWTFAWKRDLSGRLLVMEHALDSFRASLEGFRGFGSTQEAALDDLLACMKRYCDEAVIFRRSLAPGGRLYAKMQQLDLIVDQVVKSRSTGCE
jgi:hypothetical protein